MYFNNWKEIKLFCMRKIIVLFSIVATLGVAQDSDIKNQGKFLSKIKDIEKRNEFYAQDTSYIILLNKEAYNQRYINTGKLHSLASKGLKYSRNIQFLFGEGYSLYNLGIYYSDKDTPKSIYYIKKAILIFKEINNHKYYQETSNELALAYANQGNYAEALNIYLDIIDYGKRISDTKNQTKTYLNIALLYEDLQEYNESIPYLDKAISLSNTKADLYSKALALSKKAWALYKTDKSPESLKAINESISIFESNNHQNRLYYSYAIKGLIYSNIGKYKWAIHWFKQSEAIHNHKIHDKKIQVRVLDGLAWAYFKTDKKKLSKNYAIKAFSMAKKIKHPMGIRQSARTLNSIYKDEKKYMEALKYHTIVFSLSDSLSTSENKNSLLLQKTKMAYEAEKQKALAEKERDLTQQKYINYIIMLLGFILLITVFIYKRGTDTQKKLTIELSLKSKDLEGNAIELKEINKTKDQLFSIIGHDLRSPIAALQDVLKLFKNGDIKPKELLEYIPRLKGDVDHIWFTLNNLLSWSQSQMKGATINAKEISLNVIATNNINFLSEIAESKKIVIKNDIPEHHFAWADENHISVVFRNLLSNALKFTPENGHISIKIEEEKEDYNFWKICIKDTGIGMNQDILDKIFNKDTTITTYGTNDEKGTGLGLALCKEMIEKNKGAIWVESTLNIGSSFYFTIPKKVIIYKKVV